MNNLQLAGERFRLSDGEVLRMQGYVQYARGRISFLDGDAYLTTRRFVFCRKPRLPLELGRLLRGKKIVFAFPLDELQSINQRHRGLDRIHVLRLRNSAEFGILLGARRESWLLAMGAAVRQVRGGSPRRYRQELIEFA